VYAHDETSAPTIPPSGSRCRRAPDTVAGCEAVLADPKAKARIAELGGEPLLGSPAACGRMLAEESEKWGRVVRAANIKVKWRADRQRA
jgi:hypothetical protein